MTVYNVSATLDGVHDINLTALNRTLSWDGGYIGYFSVYDGDAANTDNYNFNLTGSNWTITTLRFPGDAQQNLTLTDLNANSGRYINYLRLADHSVVNLLSTQVDFIFGSDPGNYDIDLGSTRSKSIILYEATANLTISGTGRAEMVHIVGDATIDLQDDAKIYSLKLDAGNHNITTENGFLESFFSYDGRETIHIGAGGAGQMIIGGDVGLQRVTADGYLGSLQVWNDNRAIVHLNGGAGSIQTSNGNDRVFTTGFVQTVWTNEGKDFVSLGDGGAGAINTGNDNDTVLLGAGSVGLVNAGSGDDRILASQLDANQGTYINGASGTDFLSLLAYRTNALTLDLGNGGYQKVPGVGGDAYISLNSIEYFASANGADVISGSYADNRVFGNGGQDTMHGADGDDSLFGGGAPDALFGDNGSDRLFGGLGNDTMDGGAANDTLRGDEGNDTFVFNAGGGNDLFLDFTPTGGQSDRIELDHNLWAGTKTAADVVNDFGSVASNGNVVLNFGGGDRVVLSTIHSLAGLDAHIDIV